MIGRVIRAFFTAIRMTLRGETAPSAIDRATAEADARAAARYPKLSAWVKAIPRLAHAIRESGGDTLDTLHVKVNRRELSARTIIDTIAFHAVLDYPRLLRDAGLYTILAIQATNLNDRYEISQLGNAADLPDALKPLINALRDHLDAIPTDAPVSST